MAFWAVGTLEYPPAFLPATTAPAIGAKIYWIEYDFRKNRSAYRMRGRGSSIISNVAGYLILADPVTPGASGGCAYNEDGEVVGLITFYNKTDDRKKVGGITALYGDWWNDLPGDGR